MLRADANSRLKKQIFAKLGSVRATAAESTLAIHSISPASGAAPFACLIPEMASGSASLRKQLTIADCLSASALLWP